MATTSNAAIGAKNQRGPQSGRMQAYTLRLPQAMNRTHAAKESGQLHAQV